MKFAAEMRKMQRQYPSVFPDEVSVLHHLFFVIGNGYHWDHGQLVSREREPYRHVRQDPMGSLFEGLEWEIWRKPLKCYPVSKYSAITKLPTGIQDDWLLAAMRSVLGLRYFETTSSDEKAMDRVIDRFQELLEKRGVPFRLTPDRGIAQGVDLTALMDSWKPTAKGAA